MSRKWMVATIAVLACAMTAGAQTVITNMQYTKIQLPANKAVTYWYRIWVPSGCGELRVVAENLPITPTANLYVGPSSARPTYAQTTSAGESKRIVVGYPQAGWWYVWVTYASPWAGICNLHAVYNAAIFSEVKLGNERKVVWLSSIPGTLTIDKNKETWVITHGKAMPTPVIGGADISLKNALALSKAKAPGTMQVLTADWMECSYGQIWDLTNTRWVTNVGTAFATSLVPIFGNKNINLLGHSWGTYVSYEMSKQIYNKTKKKVYTMYMLDPAAMGFNYNYGAIDFRTYSTRSMAFLTSEIEGNAELAKRATHSIVVGIGWNSLGVAYAGHCQFKDITLQWFLDQIQYGKNPRSATKIFSPVLDPWPIPWAGGQFNCRGWSGTAGVFGTDYEGVLILSADRIRPVSLKYRVAIQKKWWFFGWHYYYVYEDRYTSDF